MEHGEGVLWSTLLSRLRDTGPPGSGYVLPESVGPERCSLSETGVEKTQTLTFYCDYNDF